MKQTFLVFLLALFLCSTANAVPFWFDADGSSPNDKYNPVYIEELHGEINGEYKTYQTVGQDEILNNGDAFYHQNPFQLGVIKANLAGSGTQYYAPPEGELFANLSGLSGTISNYNDGPDANPTTLNNHLGIIDDTYRLDYTPYVGQIDLRYDSNSNWGNSGSDLIASFDVIRGGGDVQAENNSTLTSDIGLDLVATQVNSGYFFFDDNGSKGLDVADWLAEEPANRFFIALTDSSVNLTGFSPNLQREAFELLTDDNGTDIEFNAVPEPSTLILFGLGLLGLAGFSRKKFSKK